MQSVYAFISENIASFHARRLESVQNLDIRKLIKRKNPYLLRAKNINTAEILVGSLLEASLSSSEEEMFGHFLEELAIFVNQQAYHGQKSSAEGIDLEFNRDHVRYIVAIKSGPNWGNSSQVKRLRDNFKTALKVLRQSPQTRNARAVLGICYGKCRNSDDGDFLKLCGQSFWEFISGNPNLYIEIMEQIGAQTSEQSYLMESKRAEAQARLVSEFSSLFCTQAGAIDWTKLIEFNASG